MQVVKRDGRIVDFDKQKILAAIEKANAEVKPRERANKENIKEIVEYITGLDKKRILVEDIQDIIEEKLMEYGKYFLAKKYITYRYTRELVRKANTTDQSIKELIDGESEYWNNENSNKNARVVTTQRDYLAGITSTDITRRFLLPKDVVEAHDEGIIHFHDADYFAQNALTNCELINLDDMLQNGTIMNGVMIEKPHRFLTAMTIATQIILAVTSSTYGGATVSLTHLAPFVKSSYDRYYKKMDRTAAGLEPDPRPDGHLLCRAYARVTPPRLDVNDKLNGSATLDIRPHRRYVVDKAAAGFSRLPPCINFALFAPQMVFTRNLGLTQINKASTNMKEPISSPKLKI